VVSLLNAVEFYAGDGLRQNFFSGQNFFGRDLRGRNWLSHNFRNRNVLGRGLLDYFRWAHWSRGAGRPDIGGGRQPPGALPMEVMLRGWWIDRTHSEQPRYAGTKNRMAGFDRFC
jgi:hypothetical protein